MKELNPKEIFELLVPGWERAITEGRYHDAIVTGLLGYFVFREKKDDAYANVSLTWIWGAIEELHKELRIEQSKSEAEPVCSFCGLGQPRVRLAAGPGVFICDSCVTTFSESFGKKKPK